MPDWFTHRPSLRHDLAHDHKRMNEPGHDLRLFCLHQVSNALDLPRYHMNDHLTVKDAISLTGMSESTIKRLIREVTSDPDHSNRSHILPSHDEVEARRKAKEPYVWRISRDLLLESYPQEEPDEVDAKPSGSESIGVGSTDGIIAVLEKSIAVFEAELEAKNRQIAEFQERQREQNVLLKQLQGQLTLPAAPSQRAAVVNVDDTEVAEKGNGFTGPRSIWGETEFEGSSRAFLYGDDGRSLAFSVGEVSSDSDGSYFTLEFDAAALRRTGYEGSLALRDLELFSQDGDSLDFVRDLPLGVSASDVFGTSPLEIQSITAAVALVNGQPRQIEIDADLLVTSPADYHLYYQIENDNGEVFAAATIGTSFAIGVDRIRSNVKTFARNSIASRWSALPLVLSNC